MENKHKPIQVKIRPVKLGDLPQIVACHNDVSDSNLLRNEWLNAFHDCKNNSFVAIHLNHVVGFIFVRENMMLLLSVYQKYLGGDIEKSLVERCLQNRQDLRFHIRTTNTKGIAHYKSIGFVVEKTIPEYYDAPPCDAFEMVHRIILK